MHIFGQIFQTKQKGTAGAFQLSTHCPAVGYGDMSMRTEVSRRPGRGRCLIAAQDFAVGDLVLEAEPLSAVLEDTHVRVHCARCFGSLVGDGGSKTSSRCSSCKNIWYCSRKCQKVDWVEHKMECKAWQSERSHGTRKATRTLRLAARILYLMNRSADNSNSTTPSPDQVREDVAELIDHNVHRSPTQQEEYRLMAAFVSSMCVSGGGEAALSWPSADGRGFEGMVETVYGLLGKLSCNTFSITHGLGTGVVGCGLYLEVAPANHSCRPNAIQTFALQGRALSLRCIRPIRQGEEITIGITCLARPRRIRRKLLKESYFFDCRCERCESSEGKREDAWMDGFACPVPKCGGLCPPMSREGNKIPMPGDLLTCDKCGATRCAWEAKREATAVGDILGVSEAGIDGHFDSTTSMEDLEQARLRATRCLHRGNWMMAEILAALVSVGLDLEIWGPAAQYACEGIESQRICWSAITPFFPSWANQLAIAGKLLLWGSQPARAVPYLEEAASAIQVIYGSEHLSHRNVRDMLAQARAECGA